MLDFFFNKVAALALQLQPATLLRDSNKDVFLWNLQNFEEHLFKNNISKQLLLEIRRLSKYFEIFLSDLIYTHFFYMKPVKGHSTESFLILLWF